MAFTNDDARAYIAGVRWQFAKTMPQWPHEYTVSTWRPDPELEFFEFVVLIRHNGIVKPWPRDAAAPRYRLTYLQLDGWEYWSMGAPVPETTVINRAFLTQSERRMRLDALDVRPDSHVPVGAANRSSSAIASREQQHASSDLLRDGQPPDVVIRRGESAAQPG